MALVLVATVGASNANSYTTLAEADAYFEGHVYSTTWDSKTDPQKEAALVMATRLLDSYYDWAGWCADASVQALQWPRYGVLDAQRYQDVPEDEIPSELKEATAELAQALLAKNRAADSEVEANKLRAMKIDKIAFEFGAGVVAKVFPDSAARLLPPWWGTERGLASGTLELVRT